jgi:hypothetical protein
VTIDALDGKKGAVGTWLRVVRRALLGRRSDVPDVDLSVY